MINNYIMIGHVSKRHVVILSQLQYVLKQQTARQWTLRPRVPATNVYVQ